MSKTSMADRTSTSLKPISNNGLTQANWRQGVLTQRFLRFLGPVLIGNLVNANDIKSNINGQEVGCYIDGECENSSAIQIVPNTRSVNACWDECDREGDCLYFTFYSNDDLCILYSSCTSVNYDCDNCITARVSNA